MHQSLASKCGYFGDAKDNVRIFFLNENNPMLNQCLLMETSFARTVLIYFVFVDRGFWLKLNKGLSEEGYRWR